MGYQKHHKIIGKNKTTLLLGFEPGFGISRTDLSTPSGIFGIGAVSRTEKLGDTCPVSFARNPHSYAVLSLHRAACRAIQATDRRPELRSEVF